MDGVVLAFNDMTGQCLKCHATVRDNKFDIRMEHRDSVTSGRSSSDRGSDVGEAGARSCVFCRKPPAQR
jgi:hypothetical protein